MSEELLRGLTLVTALGAGLTAGVLFAFSTFVMRALDTLPPARAIDAMNAINRFAPNAWFMTAVFSAALGSLVLIVGSLLGDGGRDATLRIVGSALFLVSVAITVACNVPRNDALARVGSASAGADRTWAAFSHDWTLWNHVRTLGAFAGTVALTLAYR
ncbi:anthrone oxygenase family protein [Conexibacter woesei]|uniref:DUF1772 domain-containing protein n=1 Tax=Conexibacter woesei (strain DSM 14684 / CCUG 47730 / CIP 108061 / JCM 11494 / NBRC 100937 / ID131577) TaxID=469383 RepID=D3FBG5_CONWI|nr:anthrone oxygenase family protein [Conexibacter woesei]ADB49334.1 Protein of unknown function DUF2266, transmembrane [Conexibacter woesei DSM 14684]